MKKDKEFIIKLYELNDKLVNLISLMKTNNLEVKTKRPALAPDVSVTQFLPFSLLVKHVNRHLN
jgi:hypothetical protein